MPRLIFRAFLAFLLAIFSQAANAAAVVNGITFFDTGNVAVYTTAAFTPATNDLLVVGFRITGTAVVPTVTTSSGLTFTKITNSGTLDYLYIANSLATNVSMTLSVDVTGDSGTGIALSVERVSGMSRTGASASLQTFVNTGASGTAPGGNYPASCLTGNPTLLYATNNTNPAALTPTTNWTERADSGYATPTTGMANETRDSGFTSTNVTWGSNSASNWAVVATELDTSSAPAGGVPGWMFGSGWF